MTRPGGQIVLMVYHRRSLFFLVYRGFQRFLPIARRLGLHFEGARAGETQGLIARHFTVEELRRKLVGAGLRDVWIKPYGQDAELLPLPRRHPAADHRAHPALGEGPDPAPLRPPARRARDEAVVPRLLLVTPAELTRDPRARRAADRREGARVRRRRAHRPHLGRGAGAARRRPDRPHRAAGAHEPAVEDRRSARAEIQRRSASCAASTGSRASRLRTRGLRRAGRTIGRADVVHANDLDTLPAAYLLAKELHSRLVYDAHELYAEFDPNPPRIARRAARPRIERKLARRADAVVTVSEPIAEELRRRLGVEPIVVLNAPELDAREPPEPARGTLRAVYQGAFGTGTPARRPARGGPARAERPADTARDRSTRDALERVLPADLRERVLVEDPVPPSDVVTALHGHHVGLLFDRPLTRNAELSAPNKLFEYLMAGLAVVAPDLPGLRWLAEEELGVLFEAGSPESFGAALEALAADPDRARAAAGERPPRGGRALQRRGAARGRSRRRGERLRPVRSELNDILADPADGEALSLDVEERDGDDVVTGTLRSESGRSYPIRGGIPRFVEVEDEGQAQTQSSFGFKWTKRDSFGSEGMQNELHGWLLDRYGFASGDEMRDVLRFARSHARRRLRRRLRDVRVDARGLERDRRRVGRRGHLGRDRRRARAARAVRAARTSSRPTFSTCRSGRRASTSSSRRASSTTRRPRSAR